MRSSSSSEIETCGDHRGGVPFRLVDAAEQVERVGLEARLLARDLDPTLRARRIFREQREVGEVEREVGIVDDRGRQLGERLLGALGVTQGEQRFGTHDHGLDQVLFLVDEVERRLDGLERTVGIPLILQQDPRDAHAWHRIVRAQLGERAVVTERALGVALCVGDRRGERDDIRVGAIELLHALEDLGGVVDAAVLECGETAIDVCFDPILASHGRCIPRFAIVNT
jgi:hypothetical protein